MPLPSSSSSAGARRPLPQPTSDAPTPSEELPKVLRDGDRKLWWKVGLLRMSCQEELSEFELQTLRNMEKEGLREFQYRSDDTNGGSNK